MSKLLNVIKSIDTLSAGMYMLSGEYVSYKDPISLKCIKHDEIFEVPRADRLYSLLDNTHLDFCPKCKYDRLHSKSVEVECAYCGKILLRPASWCANNKTKLAFCSKEHKALGQRISSGIIEVQPAHYGTTSTNYRQVAFNHYEHKCAVCDWCEDERILDVHHKDEDRSNNDVKNLVILCPICHAKITRGHYILIHDDNRYTLYEVNMQG